MQIRDLDQAALANFALLVINIFRPTMQFIITLIVGTYSTNTGSSACQQCPAGNQYTLSCCAGYNFNN